MLRLVKTFMRGAWGGLRRGLRVPRGDCDKEEKLLQISGDSHHLCWSIEQEDPGAHLNSRSVA